MSDEEKKETAPAADAAQKAGDAAAEPQKHAVPAGPVEPERADGKSNKEKRRERAEQKAQVEADWKQARLDYKAARRRAGKSNAPKIVGGVLAAVVLLAGGAAGGWFFTNQYRVGQIDQLQAQLSSTQQELNQANDQVTATNSILDGGSKAYAGSWSGDLVSTLGAATKRCYGASEKSMSLNIESISATGQMQLDVNLLYHGHETATLANDEKSDSGDSMLKSGQVTSTFSSKSFSFRVESGKDGDYAVVTVSPTTSADAHIQLGVVVESYYKDGLVETDQYLLKKAGDESSASEGTLDSAGGSSVDSASSSAADAR